MNAFITKTSSDLQLAVDYLLQGKLVAIPTETVYGLAGNATDGASIVQIFQVKNRPHFDPLIVHSYSLEALMPFVKDLPSLALDLAAHFWPGPLTLLLPKRTSIPDLVTSGNSTVAVRVPNHPLSLQLLKQLPFPLAAPSANPFGYISPTSPEHVYNQLQGKIPYILDGGVCTIGLESTIIGFPENGLPTIYRLGGIPLEAIRKRIGEVTLLPHSSSNPKAPGQLQSHYAPRKPLYIGDISEMLKLHTDGSFGVLSFKTFYAEVEHQIQLSARGDLEEAARQLFAALRTLDQLPIDRIFTELLPDTGLGRAINDRLKRAAFRQT